MRSTLFEDFTFTTNKVIIIFPFCYHVPGGFAVGAEPVRRPGEAPREGVSSKNGWGWGGVMREIGALVQGDGWV